MAIVTQASDGDIILISYLRQAPTLEYVGVVW